MKPTLTMAIALAVASFALPALAERQPGQEQQQGNAQQEPKQEIKRKQGQQQQKAHGQTGAGREQTGQPVVVTGRVIAAKSFSFKGQDQKHVLAKIQTASGKTVIANLGTVQDVRNARLRKGQQVTLTGPAGRVNGRPVIIANKVRTHQGPTLTIVRIIPANVSDARPGQPKRQTASSDSPRPPQSGPQNQGQKGQGQDGFDGKAQSSSSEQSQDQQVRRGSNVRVVNGRIVDTQEMQLKGLDQKHLFATLQTRGGQQVLVDLGPKGQLKDVNVTNGEFISAYGPVGRVNQRPVLFAIHVADIVTIDRSDMRKRRQQQHDKAQAATSKREPSTKPSNTQGGATGRATQSESSQQRQGS